MLGQDPVIVLCLEVHGDECRSEAQVAGQHTSQQTNRHIHPWEAISSVGPKPVRRFLQRQISTDSTLETRKFQAYNESLDSAWDKE